MALGTHSQLSGANIHQPFFAVFADSTARTAASGYDSSYVNRVALQQSDNTIWLVTAVTAGVPTWTAISAGGSGGGSGYLLAANNLSDLASASTARTNLGLGTAATHASTDFDAAGSASTAQSNAHSYTDSAISALNLGSASTHAASDFDSAGSAAAAATAAISTAASSAASLYVPLTEVGSASGVASLDGSTKVPAAQLPVATTSSLGAVKVDGSTITISGGVISAVGGGGGGTGTGNVTDKGDWASDADYVVHDIVKRYELYYISIASSTGADPATDDDSYWHPLSARLNDSPVSDLGADNAGGTASSVARADHVHKRSIGVELGGATAIVHRDLNFIAGDNVSIETAGDGENDRVNVTISASGGGSGSGSYRTTATFSSADLADGAMDSTHTIDCTGKSVAFARMAADKPCWVRIYPNEAMRTADITRSVGTAAALGAQPCVEWVFTSDVLSVVDVPPPVCIQMESEPASTFAITVVNRSGSESTINLTATVLVLES